ncbi:DUF2515 domain-containing protein [Oceanobacillus piezotolerans]|uniref:DUF2515 domain-containing protein n=1 Tax=Oceanobacillus piezotolerans TaxID=2448030 RepID=A0A498DG63_9BACI|nr:DUF2515 family protein [Oceanobacillus piezotolerans]RLL48535.1 DUF2515 domain-containing protein [Oceanobacillus piezotolerans]
MLNWSSYIHYILKLTKSQNKDNISRTKAYQQFYVEYPEIKWAFLASVVSRNAGWNMTDLALPSYQALLGRQERERLFMTYERANWLIFSDAYPQLLIYKLSTQEKRPLFQLLTYFHVSKFMIKEWLHFWKTKDRERLMTSLIINEQNIIEHPVINQPFFSRQVFHKLPYKMQDLFLMSAVILPTKTDELIGLYVNRFTNLDKRIQIGKQLGAILFDYEVFKQIHSFTSSVEHTGSRRDYEKYKRPIFTHQPVLRLTYPVITHQDTIRKDWYPFGGSIPKDWFESVNPPQQIDIQHSFYFKRAVFDMYASLKMKIK